MNWVNLMRDNLDTALDFTKKIRKVRNIKEVLQVVLFGSVARNEDTAASDIDIAVIHDSQNPAGLQTDINKLKHSKIQISYIHIDRLSKEPELVSALTGEGILLYGHPINVKFEKKELKPKLLVVYDLSKLPKTDQMKLNRALHGSISESKYKGKKYKTEIHGILNEEGVKKLAKAVVLIDKKKATKIFNVLKRYNAKWREIALWGY